MATDPPVTGGTPTLRGRSDECTLLDGMLVAVRAGQSRTLLLRGEAGVGKTALLEHLIASASDLRVVRAEGVESEMELVFAGLHQICAPLLDHARAIPAPQLEALEIVFGISAGPPPDPFLVGLTALSLLGEAAEHRPLLCVIDDAQWLDRASAQTLAFVARRLLAERVALVFAAREPAEELRGLPELEVRGLRAGDARALLRSAVQFLLDEPVRDRIVAETRGNPLALLELPRGLTATELAGGFGLLGAHAMPGRIVESYERRLKALPQDTQQLLLLAAAEPLGDPLLLWRAADAAGLTGAAAAAAETDGLVSLGARVTFRHPLVRSAVYRSATVQERRAAHLALAAATDREADPDRRAWHLAAAASRPDEAVAEELERSAGRAEARGGLAAAAAYLERSVALSVDPERRADRALAGADASLRAGAFETALGLLATAEAFPLDDLRRARVDLLHAETAFSQRRGSDAPPLLLRAAKTLVPLDRELARETYLDAWSAALFAGRLATAGNLHEVSREARRAPPARAPGRPSGLLLDGFALLFTDGRAAATPLLRQAAAAFASEDATGEEVLRWGWLATAAAVTVWDHDTCLTIADRGVQLARDSGALAFLTVAVNVLTQAVALSGDFRAATLLRAEADAVKEATGTQIAPYGALVLGAFQGGEAEVSSLIDATIADATAGGQGTAVQYAKWARAVALNAAGRYAEALPWAQEASEDTPELFVSSWALSEVIEAGARTGELRTAESALERLAERTDAAATSWSSGVEARARALLSAGDTAEALYRKAIDHLERTRLRPELARAHLLYGEWLRRENRRSDARAQLRAAHEQLLAIGMESFAGRARVELLATGEKVRRRTPETRDELTAQERQIAMLAREGLSNPEIGGRMFLSPRTVEWHLRKVFTKLDISSRRELVTALPGMEPELASA
ncbi:MAG TPA: AAA family ATPase [Solirubrobacteraceae bacterium]|jgi:DNA-binding CsgD family transcriptional regulator|nr:AAA family ATPase [Solirubrobacteraceae bacterium]